MSNRTLTVKGNLSVAKDLLLKDGEQYEKIQDFITKHAVVGFKFFPFPEGCETQAEAIAALEQIIKDNPTPDKLNTIWVIKRDKDLSEQNDRYDEFIYNQDEEHLERIGSSVIDFSDIESPVVFKNTVDFKDAISLDDSVTISFDGVTIAKEHAHVLQDALEGKLKNNTIESGSGTFLATQDGAEIVSSDESVKLHISNEHITVTGTLKDSSNNTFLTNADVSFQLATDETTISNMEMGDDVLKPVLGIKADSKLANLLSVVEIEEEV